MMKQAIIYLSILFCTILVFSGCEDPILDPEDTTPPGEVSNLSATPGDARVLLEWDIPSDNDLAQVQLTFIPANDLTQPIPISPEFNSREITGLENGIEYSFTVRTVDSSSNKSAGTSIQATPEEPVIVGPVEMTDDRDGKVYKVVTIGDQVWMAENLAYLPEGSPLSPNNSGSHSEAFTRHYYAYGLNNGGSADDIVSNTEVKEHVDTYGLLYNWYAAINMPETISDSTALKDYLVLETDIQGVCPAGWHLPSDEEYQELEMYLGMSEEDANSKGYRGISQEGNMLKSEDLWETPLGTNSYDFEARPAGRWKKDKFEFVEQYTYFWTSSLCYFELRTDESENEYVGANPWLRYLKHNESRVARQSWEDFNGYSIRCVKDTEE